MNLKRIRLDERSLPLKVTYRMINNRVEYNTYIVRIVYTYILYMSILYNLYKYIIQESDRTEVLYACI